MKTITKQYQVFSYDELTEEGKAAAIEKLYDLNVDHEWYDLDYYNEKLEAIGFINPEISFSGFCSQGDGASFVCNYVDLDKVFSHLCYCQTKKGLFSDTVLLNQVLTMMDKNIIEFNISIDRASGFYVHEKTCFVNYNFEAYPPEQSTKKNSSHNHYLSDAFESWLDDAEKTVIDMIESLRYDLCQDIYKSLEKEHDYLTSREAIEETIRCNDYEFTSNGNLF